MEQRRDQAIKLFGKKIQLLAVREVLWTGREDGGDEMKVPSNKQDNQEHKYKNEETQKFQKQHRIDEQEISESNEEKASNQQNKNINNSTDKSHKKPDKILPCPRCNSMDTKFCYFNNYNVNQPRHFCKNCQRYWTEGGSMRNVPAGAGRRKSKRSTANHHHITISNCAQADICESINHQSPLKLNGTVLSFNAGALLCESLNSNEEGNKALNSNLPSFPPYLNGTLWPNPWSYTPYLGVPWLCSGLSTTVLGKRSREGNIVNHSNILRIEGHEKDEKCSEWAELGFQNVKPDRILKSISTEASQVLCANPAAFSRYLSFQERL